MWGSGFGRFLRAGFEDQLVEDEAQDREADADEVGHGAGDHHHERADREHGAGDGAPVTGKDKAELIRFAKIDRERATAICREIRDSETATYTEKLEAMKLLNSIQSMSIYPA